MTKDEHIKRHKLLHDSLDELMADWIRHTDGLPSKATIMELLRWSYKQTLNPTDDNMGKPTNVVIHEG